jgi:lysozyme
MSILGLDLSHWRTVRSFTQMAAAGVKFVYVKASGSSGFADPTFVNNWHGLANAGILRGAYHTYLPGQDPAGQALFYSRVVQAADQELPAHLAGGVLPPAVEFGEGSASPLVFRQFLKHVERLFGCRPLIFTSRRGWFKPHPAWSGEYGLWVASWHSEKPRLPGGWSTWVFHQYTNFADGRKYGLEQRCVGANIFNGDLAQLQALSIGCLAGRVGDVLATE